ncbi:MAG: LysR family transcriptional regulator [Deltaproteobacteria bacterium]|nr:LysR family transcriptional regulator [Deltaproteobacteria bacterium]
MNPEIPYSKVKTFYHIVNEGSFSKSAKKLFITPGAVSQQIKDLEDRLGKKLFERSEKKLKLTTDGANFFDLVAPAIEQFENVVDEFEQISGLLKGTVSVASFSIMSINYLPVTFNAFKTKYPHCEIILYTAAGADIHSMVISGRVDFGIASTQKLPAELMGKTLWQFKRYFIAPLRHPLATMAPLTANDIAQAPLVMPDRRTVSGNRFFRELESHNRKLKVTVEAADWQVVKKYVEMGFGVSVIPEIAIDPSDRNRLFLRDLVEIMPEAGVSKYGIVIKRRKYLSRAAKELIKSFCPEFNFDALQGSK